MGQGLNCIVSSLGGKRRVHKTEAFVLTDKSAWKGLVVLFLKKKLGHDHVLFMNEFLEFGYIGAFVLCYSLVREQELAGGLFILIAATFVSLWHRLSHCLLFGWHGTGVLKHHFFLLVWLLGTGRDCCRKEVDDEKWKPHTTNLFGTG